MAYAPWPGLIVLRPTQRLEVKLAMRKDQRASFSWHVDSGTVYYNGGEALHGYSSIPPYPASHGCLRTPTTYSRQIMNWVRLGDRIDVYR